MRLPYLNIPTRKVRIASQTAPIAHNDCKATLMATCHVGTWKNIFRNPIVRTDVIGNMLSVIAKDPLMSFTIEPISQVGMKASKKI